MAPYRRGGDYTLPIVTAAHDTDAEDYALTWEMYNYGTEAEPEWNGRPVDTATAENDVSGLVRAAKTAQSTALGSHRAIATATDKIAAITTALGNTNTVMTKILDIFAGYTETDEETHETYEVLGMTTLLGTVCSIIASLRMMNLHIGKAGIITGVDDAETGEDIPRHTDPYADSDQTPDPSGSQEP